MAVGRTRAREAPSFAEGRGAEKRCVLDARAVAGRDLRGRVARDADAASAVDEDAAADRTRARTRPKDPRKSVPRAGHSTPGFLAQLASLGRSAGPADEALIRQHSDDFFEPLAPALARGDLFLGYQTDELVAIGVAERSQLAPDHASIGMFVLADRRRQGHGTATIQALIAHCRATGLTPIAGCYYYNHNSKKTLEKAGMYSKTRLFKAQL